MRHLQPRGQSVSSAFADLNVTLIQNTLQMDTQINHHSGVILLSALHEQQYPYFDMWISIQLYVFIFSHTRTLLPIDYLQLCCLMSTCLENSVFFPLLIFSLSLLWPENPFYMILIYLNVLKFVLWPRI